MKSHSGNGEAVYKQKEESGRSRLAEDESFILFCMSSLAERKKKHCTNGLEGLPQR